VRVATGRRRLGFMREVVGNRGSRNGDSVSLGVALLSNSDGLGDVSRSRSAAVEVDSDGLGDRCRAGGRDRDIRSGDSRCHDGGSGHRCWAALAATAVDCGRQSLGDVAGGQVCRVDGRVSTLADGSRAWNPSVSSRSDSSCDIMRR
jgi:hypothetical protein